MRTTILATLGGAMSLTGMVLFVSALTFANGI